VEKGSKISVFRFGLVGPKFELNLFLKQNLSHGRFVERKGKWLIFHYFPYEKDLRRRLRFRICPLFDCRTQQIYRIFLTWIFNIRSSKQIICCDRDLACKRNDQAILFDHFG